MTKLDAHFQCKPFHKLTLSQWYAICQAREKVFIVEQNCPYLDSDGQDEMAWHILGKVGDKIACYARILPPAVRFTSGEFAGERMPAIGRVLTVAEHRGHGLASELMKFAITQTCEMFDNAPIYISAQVYLLDFYQDLGFIPQGGSYLEDNIPHQDMVKQ